jgi:hypothetical protein
MKLDLNNFIRNIDSSFIFALDQTLSTTTLLENVEEFLLSLYFSSLFAAKKLLGLIELFR